MADWTDRFADLTEVTGEAGARLTRAVRQAMTGQPGSEASHQAAMDAYADTLRSYLPVDEEGMIVNAIVDFVEGRPDVTRVAQVVKSSG